MSKKPSEKSVIPLEDWLLILSGQVPKGWTVTRMVDHEVLAKGKEDA